MTKFGLADAADVAGLLRDAAQAEIMPRFRRLAAADVRTKSGPLDLVTEADEAAERVITAGLQDVFPGCVVVGEEAASADPSLLDTLGSADLAFVVDPVDGTANYAAGLPLFATMAAAIVRGEVVGAIIHDPVGNDTAFAVRGEGAWTEQPDGRRSDLRVAAAVPVAEMSGAASWRFLPEVERLAVNRNLPRVAASFVYRCAAHEYRMLAGGHCHYLLYGRLMPWDHAPGWLLHQEAGGFSAQFDGTPYRPTIRQGGLILTPDEASFHALRTALLET
ncbi:inositol monophosphatase family protein [Limobrevibacterium gyesilva]|uniref:Inositol monophosphatase n=1 Tax=Limobrevibacterium gyesilva TaxID=2991712 RepID=A0AA41YJM8_9PROT|nr:inositol monophosphatase family protein [Limobrevibacterium gyesilva]MCW3473805.1 inositol monophosphatase [Limobrevibacterium gyesilva]